MSCNQSREHFTPFLDGQLPAEDAVRLQAHLDDCADCRNELQEMRRLLEALGGWPEVRVPDTLLPQLKQALRAEWASQSPSVAETEIGRGESHEPSFWARLGAWRVAAMFCCLMLTAYAVWQEMDHQPVTPQSSAEYSQWEDRSATRPGQMAEDSASAPSRAEKDFASSAPKEAEESKRGAMRIRAVDEADSPSRAGRAKSVDPASNPAAEGEDGYVLLAEIAPLARRFQADQDLFQAEDGQLQERLGGEGAPGGEPRSREHYVKGLVSGAPGGGAGRTGAPPSPGAKKGGNGDAENPTPTETARPPTQPESANRQAVDPGPAIFMVGGSRVLATVEALLEAQGLTARKTPIGRIGSPGEGGRKPAADDPGQFLELELDAAEFLALEKALKRQPALRLKQLPASLLKGQEPLERAAPVIDSGDAPVASNAVPAGRRDGDSKPPKRRIVLVILVE
ncbi:MAG: zf-HC2 domain-containing protein [Planctomycetes bacterium]|nr:zf-HC2 domain-containing protein [Planctomycetota bacterium]